MSDKALTLAIIDRFEHEMVKILIGWNSYQCAIGYLFARMDEERHILQLGAPLELWPQRLQGIRDRILHIYRQERLN